MIRLRYTQIRSLQRWTNLKFRRKLQNRIVQALVAKSTYPPNHSYFTKNFVHKRIPNRQRQFDIYFYTYNILFLRMRPECLLASEKGPNRSFYIVKNVFDVLEFWWILTGWLIGDDILWQEHPFLAICTYVYANGKGSPSRKIRVE